MPAVDLPDLNVWLALADPDYEHHSRTCRYWETEAAPKLAFTRITMLGLLRLLSNRKVMRDAPFSPEEAWLAYRSFLALEIGVGRLGGVYGHPSARNTDSAAYASFAA